MQKLHPKGWCIPTKAHSDISEKKKQYLLYASKIWNYIFVFAIQKEEP
jgi:hypothetical protein